MTKPARPTIRVTTQGPSWVATYRDPSRTWVLQDTEGAARTTTAIDGYDVGDRLLEGVQFDVAPLADGTGFMVTSQPGDHTYLKALAMKSWMRRLAEHVADGLDGEEIGWRPSPHAPERPTPAPMTLPLVSINALTRSMPPRPMRPPSR